MLNTFLHDPQITEGHTKLLPITLITTGAAIHQQTAALPRYFCRKLFPAAGARVATAPPKHAHAAPCCLCHVPFQVCQQALLMLDGQNVEDLALPFQKVRASQQACVNTSQKTHPLEVLHLAVINELQCGQKVRRPSHSHSSCISAKWVVKPEKYTSFFIQFLYLFLLLGLPVSECLCAARAVLRQGRAEQQGLTGQRRANLKLNCFSEFCTFPRVMSGCFFC